MSIDPLAPIAPQYQASEPTTLILKEKKMSLTGDGASIKDGNGNKLFKVDAKVLTLSQRRNFCDANGNVLGQMRHRKFPEMHKSMYIGTEKDEKRCRVKTKGLLNITKCDADILLNEEKIGFAEGNWRAKSFTISLNGVLVAEIKRKTNMASLVLDADSYCIEVQPGVDLAFISMITIALDELYHEDD